MTCDDSLPILHEGAAALGVQLSEPQTSLLLRYCGLVSEANARFNLTALRTPEAIVTGLILDSLSLEASLPASIRETDSLRAIDIGSGAGVPGIPLKILHPNWTMALVESIGKKAKFLEETCEQLALEPVTVLQTRAERLGWDRSWRDSAALVTARAVAPLPALLELCAPLVAPGGVLALPKGPGVAHELEQSHAAARALHVDLFERRPAPPLPGSSTERVVLLYRKTGPTPPGYPRRIGLATSRPIGSGP